MQVTTYMYNTYILTELSTLTLHHTKSQSEGHWLKNHLYLSSSTLFPTSVKQLAKCGRQNKASCKKNPTYNSLFLTTHHRLQTKINQTGLV